MLALFDLDGVLLDLDKELLAFFGGPFTENEFHEEFLPEFTNGGGYSCLKALEGADSMLEHASLLGYKVGICTSATQNMWHRKDVSMQKILNIHSEFVALQFAPIIITSGQEQKSWFANKDTVLIDDTKSTCEYFMNEGGLAIHHTTVLNTMKELNEILH